MVLEIAQINVKPGMDAEFAGGETKAAQGTQAVLGF
jgi:hypothetical protein